MGSGGTLDGLVRHSLQTPKTSKRRKKQVGPEEGGQQNHLAFCFQMHHCTCAQLSAWPAAGAAAVADLARSPAWTWRIMSWLQAVWHGAGLPVWGRHGWAVDAGRYTLSFHLVRRGDTCDHQVVFVFRYRSNGIYLQGRRSKCRGSGHWALCKQLGPHGSARRRVSR
jgi:hypothetical protein